MSKSFNYQLNFEAYNHLQLIMFDFDCSCSTHVPQFLLLVTIYLFHYFVKPASALEKEENQFLHLRRTWQRLKVRVDDGYKMPLHGSYSFVQLLLIDLVFSSFALIANSVIMSFPCKVSFEHLGNEHNATSTKSSS